MEIVEMYSLMSTVLDISQESKGEQFTYTGLNGMGNLSVGTADYNGGWLTSPRHHPWCTFRTDSGGCLGRRFEAEMETEAQDRTFGVCCGCTTDLTQRNTSRLIPSIF